MNGSVKDWTTESLLATRQAYLVPETGTRLKSGQKLGDAYLQANMPVVRQRLDQAALWQASEIPSAMCGARRPRVRPASAGRA
jgi:hypothetical protein